MEEVVLNGERVVTEFEMEFYFWKSQALLLELIRAKLSGGDVSGSEEFKNGWNSCYAQLSSICESLTTPRP